jgi:hypothetical protein
MTTIKSFGCSFVYGSDLSDADIEATDPITGFVPSALTWPALIAKQLGSKYECYALPGQGNFKIFCDILANSYQNDCAVYLINWSFVERYDYINRIEQWSTIRPSLSNVESQFYYKHLHSQLQDLISSASYIVSAAEHLTSLNCRFVMTYMDYNLIRPLNPTWHDSRYLEVLQQKLKKILVDFDGKNFLDWSKQHNFSISDAWHPLEQAHEAAANYWLPTVQQLL